MQFDSTVTLGTVFQIVTLVAIGGAAFQRLKHIEQMFELFSKRVERLESALADQAMALNRLIGRQDARDERAERQNRAH